MGTTRQAPGGVTAEEFAGMSFAGRAELVDGEVVEMAPVGGTLGGLAVRIAYELESHARRTGRGVVAVEVGFVEGAPDLAIEIVSPGDRFVDVEAKVQEYIHAGARAVWVVEPRSRRVLVHTPDNLIRIFTEADTLATDSLPDFACPVARFFSGA